MTRFQFAACEWAFPCWGDLAVKMAHEAGFTGVQLGDGGGSMQGFPLRNKRVQDYYPVSYTHLDVYKRQDQLGVILEIGSVVVGPMACDPRAGNPKNYRER